MTTRLEKFYKEEVMPKLMEQFGYTGSAAIPMALDKAVSSGDIKENDLVFLIGSGGGLAFAGAAFRM